MELPDYLGTDNQLLKPKQKEPDIKRRMQSENVGLPPQVNRNRERLLSKNQDTLTLSPTFQERRPKFKLVRGSTMQNETLIQATNNGKTLNEDDEDILKKFKHGVLNA